MGDLVDNTPRQTDDGQGSESLCSWCKDLDLNESKFLISSDTASGLLPASSKVSRSISSLITKQGTSTDDCQRPCTFCDLLWRTVHKYSPGKISSETTVCLTWEIDGRKLTKENIVVRCTRRIHVSWIDLEDKKHDAYIVLAAPSSPLQSTLSSNSRPSVDKDISFLGRVLENPSEILDLIKEWLRQCHKTHRDGCRHKYGSESAFRHLVKETYFGVVDVIDMCLTELPFRSNVPEGFIALSYVWGKDRIRERSYITTRSNVMLRIQPGGLRESWNSLPKTIQDVILLGKWLDIRYVWIDSLCIVQDSIQNWQSNAKIMHLVYLHAHFTVCAADGDVSSGLRAVRGVPSRQNPSDAKITAEKTISTHSRGGESILSAKYLPGVRLLVSKLPELVIQDSDWNGRAWTFQERMLSRRCLIFAGDRVYFQCRQMVMSQEIFPDRGEKGWSLDWTNSPLRTLAELTHKAFWFYMKSISLYTGRKLSKFGDILAAFEVVSWLLEQHFNAPLLYGLPTSHFDLALLWTPLGILDRRRVRNPEPSQHAADCPSNQEKSNELDGNGFGDKEFPSWSWCGWTNGKMEYTIDMMEGCSQNAHEWLKHHTWIQWHVRDHKGYLRPLWNRKRQYEDSSSDVRWKGYTGLPKPPPPRGDFADHNSSRPRNGCGEEYQRKRKWQDEVYNEHEYSLFAQNEIPPQLTFNGGEEDYRDSPRFHRESNGAYITALPRKYYANDSETKPDQLSRNDAAPLRAGTKYAEPEGFSRSWTETTKANSELDDYGRTIRWDLKKSSKFTSILPDHPFGVIQDMFPGEIGTQAHAMPVLQFFTMSNQFYVKLRSRTETIHQPTQILYCEVLDKAGDWCGCIKLSSSWIADKQDTPHLFIAISDAKSFTKDECPEWNYYIHKEREESEWDLFYVLLLKRNIARALWERVGLGKIFQVAFADAQWAEIKLG